MLHWLKNSTHDSEDNNIEGFVALYYINIVTNLLIGELLDDTKLNMEMTMSYDSVGSEFSNVSKYLRDADGLYLLIRCMIIQY